MGSMIRADIRPALAIAPPLRCGRAAIGSAATGDVAHAALEGLLGIARHDTVQSRRVANFILAWWNAESLGGFDLSDICAVDRKIARDVAIIVRGLAESPVAEYPEAYRPQSRNSSGFGGRRSGRARSRPPDVDEGRSDSLEPCGRMRLRQVMAILAVRSLLHRPGLPDLPSGLSRS